jgi:hypothetical protein
LTLTPNPTAGAFAADTPPQERCPFTDEIQGWQDVDDYTAIVECSGNQRYKVTFLNACRDMQGATAAKFVSRPGIYVTAGDRMIFKSQAGMNGISVIKSIEKAPKP